MIYLVQITKITAATALLLLYNYQILHTIQNKIRKKKKSQTLSTRHTPTTHTTAILHSST